MTTDKNMQHYDAERIQVLKGLELLSVSNSRATSSRSSPPEVCRAGTEMPRNFRM